MQIKKIFHPTIAESQQHCCFEFFSDNCLGGDKPVILLKENPAGPPRLILWDQA
jgi:hypothetical protein